MTDVATRPLAVKPAEGAKLLGISRSAFFDLLARGEIPSFLSGKRCRLIAVADLEVWIADQKRRAA